MAGQWNLSGTYFESCNCEATCPCVVLSAPTNGECTLLVAWHIDQGTFEDTRLDGLNVALAIYSPGHMLEVPWKVALYLDDRASPAQREALVRIFAGRAGGHPARLAGHIGEVLGVTDAPIEYRAEGRRRALRIGEVADVAVQAIDGQGGADVTVSNAPLCIAPGQPAVAAKSEHLRYRDHGMTWEVSGRNGFYSAFRYQDE